MQRRLHLIILLALLAGRFTTDAQSSIAENYFRDIKRFGEDPLVFVNKCLRSHQLLVFDDALHPAYEPFAFYNQLINDPSFSRKLNYIFLEATNTNNQPLIDSFLNGKIADSTILIKLFQDDYTGMGWRYQTYLDLFKTVHQHNRDLPDSLKIKIVGVSPPIYWEAIHTWKDYELFQGTLKSRDYFMYLEIVEKMENFKGNKSGIFLCNTRHAYKNIRNHNGELYWNTTTFFSQRNPGKTYSIRIHNVTLAIDKKKETSSAARKSTDGLNETVYKWIKMDNGHWDAAFEMNFNRPVALPFKNTIFGKTAYVGNHMLNVEKGTTMMDAYDALIFLAPLTQLHFSAEMSYIYTPQFKPELERRVRLLHGDKYMNYLEKNSAVNFDEFYRKNFEYIPISDNKLIEEQN